MRVKVFEHVDHGLDDGRIVSACDLQEVFEEERMACPKTPRGEREQKHCGHGRTVAPRPYCSDQTIHPCRGGTGLNGAVPGYADLTPPR
jgi:hypothetical protein